MFKSIRIGAAIVGLLAGSPLAVLAAGDAVMDWNQIALAATVTAGQGPVPQVRSMTIVQVSVHDAVNAVTRKHRTYLHHAKAPAGASPDAAAIAAAHRALVTLFPLQAAVLDASRAVSLAASGLTEADPGILTGERAAAAILAKRAGDGASLAQFPYVAPGAGTPGVWVATGTAPALLPGWGTVAPWVMRKGSQFRPEGPPSLGSRTWARDFNEVKEIGALDSTTRTADQTEIARFWLAPPSVIWNGVARQVIEARNLEPSDTAAVLALMYLAAADASIACWDAKYVYNFWRPQTAINNGDLDGNKRTAADPAWTPLFPTPPHPDYLSGHSTNSSAMATMLALIFGDDPGVTIVATSTTNPAFPRRWERFSQGVDEVVEARIYSGIHYRTADEVGARVGRKVARYVALQALRRAKH